MQLQNGKTVTLALPDMYAIIAAPPIGPNAIDMPNEALIAITDLIVYGGMLSLPDDDQKRLKENRRFLMAQWEVARLCCEAPRLVLRGAAGPDDLTPRDITPRDLAAIMAWFQNGGSDGVPAADGDEPGSGAPADSPSAAVE
jgi:hypothetical protein